MASAKPATAADGSCVGVSETAKAVPLVPRETTTSPGCACTPSAAPALSPAPAAIGIPDVVVAPNALGLMIVGSFTSSLLRRAIARMSRRYSEVVGSK